MGGTIQSGGETQSNELSRSSYRRKGKSDMMHNKNLKSIKSVMF